MESLTDTEEGVIFDDVRVAREAIARADRLMYAADNFSDRSEFAAAARSVERIDERMRRLLGAFNAAVPLLLASDSGEAIVAHVGETLSSEWEWPLPEEKTRDEEDES